MSLSRCVISAPRFRGSHEHAKSALCEVDTGADVLVVTAILLQAMISEGHPRILEVIEQFVHPPVCRTIVRDANFKVFKSLLPK